VANNKESGVFDTVINWLINDDHDNESDSKGSDSKGSVSKKDSVKEYNYGDDNRKS
jgi:hypothetical protein